MTAPTPIQPPAPIAPPAPAAVPLLTRLKLTEPVRLYLYTLLVVATAGCQLAGFLTAQWVQFATINGALVLGVVPAAEAVRSSVYSTRSVVQAVRGASGQ